MLNAVKIPVAQGKCNIIYLVVCVFLREKKRKEIYLFSFTSWCLWLWGCAGAKRKKRGCMHGVVP
jgi:hypothetical protein